MRRLEKPDPLLNQFHSRIIFAVAGSAMLLTILLGRFAWLQLVRQDEYQAQSESNRTLRLPMPPTRGQIYDRNGIILARNVSSNTLEIQPRVVRNKLPELLDGLSSIIDITDLDRRRFMRQKEEARRLDSVPLRWHLSDQETARFAAQSWRFPGADVRVRYLREYPCGLTASHAIGYIGRISQRDQERLEKEGISDSYRGTSHIGKVGIERSYETFLHGVPGYNQLEVTAGGRPVRQLESIAPQPGKDLVLSLDIRLQQVVEEAFGKNRGALIAIDPRNGEILAFASCPTYNPNLFVEGIDPGTWNTLNTDPDKPLMNRSVRGTYPIGSTFKPFMALAGLTYGVITPTTVIYDRNGYFELGDHKFRDSAGFGRGALMLRKALQVSSDVYFFQLAYDLGIDRISEFMTQWGFGQLTGVDIVGEQKGVLPSRQWKENRFHKPWVVGDTPSVGLGQGYCSFTLLQLCHAVAALASRGVEHTPHLVREIRSAGTSMPAPGVTSRKLPGSRADMEAVIDGMVAVTQGGTGKSVFQGFPFAAAGKTGTAQVITIRQNEKYDARRLAQKFHDHSLFISFAPAEAPRIAVAAIVENGGWGASAAGPIVRKTLDYWLLGKNDLGLPAPKDMPALPASTAKPRKHRK